MRTTGRQHGPVKRLVSPSNLGSAMPHPHDLVLGYYSVHTSAEALRTGEARIVEIATDLRRQGRIV
ncbi:hypothetical protein bAD24_III00840 [Burkholderia sp. AD24]|nr:hypothetical protein bAD24_III00840 [Burkholderia sp. AD24]